MVRVALPRTETQHRLPVLLPLQIRPGHRPRSQNADAARQSRHQDHGSDGHQRGGSHPTADPALRRFRRLSGLPLAQPAEIRPEPPVAAPSPSGGMPAEIHPQRRHAADAPADLRDTRIQKGLTAGGKTFFAAAVETGGHTSTAIVHARGPSVRGATNACDPARITPNGDRPAERFRPASSKSLPRGQRPKRKKTCKKCRPSTTRGPRGA